jgi:hypothetical protein
MFLAGIFAKCLYETGGKVKLVSAIERCKLEENAQFQ